MMEKVFESLKFIFDEALFSEYKNETHNKVRECHSIVYETLKELKDIKEAKPSEALECLEDIYLNAVFVEKEIAQEQPFFTSHYKLFGESPETHKTISEQCNTIKQSLLKAQEQEKALEVILKKCVDIDYLKNDCHFVLVLYNKIMEDSKQLTQEEFDILKRWLEECLKDL